MRATPSYIYLTSEERSCCFRRCRGTAQGFLFFTLVLREQDRICSTPSKHSSHPSIGSWGLCSPQFLPRQLHSDRSDWETLLLKKKNNNNITLGPGRWLNQKNVCQSKHEDQIVDSFSLCKKSCHGGELSVILALGVEVGERVGIEAWAVCVVP